MAKKKPEVSMSQSIKEVLQEKPELTAPQVVEFLAKKGIEVKKGLVYFVKGKLEGKRGKKAKKKAASVKNAAETSKVQEPQAETQRGEVNKSQEIRELLKTNPRMKTKQVVDTLAERGIKVLANQVYFIKGKMKGKRNRKQVEEGVETIVKPSGPVDALATIKKVKGLAEEVGGLKKLQALVEALGE